MATCIFFDDAGEPGSILADVSLAVTRTEQFHGGFETQAVLAQFRIPADVRWDHPAIGMQGEARQAGRGAGRRAEEIDEDPFLERRVLIEKNANGAAAAQNAQRGPRGLVLLDWPVARKAPVAAHQRVESGVVDRPHKKM